MDDVKLAAKKQNIDPMWKVLNKEVDLGEPTSAFDHVYLGCTQRQCEKKRYVWPLENHVRIQYFRKILGKIPSSEAVSISTRSYDVDGHAKKCVERYCELANKTSEQLYKVLPPCIDDHQFKEEELKSVRELIVRRMFTICPEMSVFATHWQSTNLHVRSQSGPEHATNVQRVDLSHSLHK